MSAPAPSTSAQDVGNVVDYLFEHSLALDGGAKAAQIVDGRTVTYRALHDRTCQVGNLLRALGVGPDDRVMMSLADGPDFVATFLGGMKIGAVTVPINTFLKPHDYRYYINDSGARVLVIDRALVPVIESIRAEIPAIEHILVAGGAPAGYADFDDAIADHAVDCPTVPRRGDDMAFWLYSSGSTGDPKGVVHTNNHIYWATELFGIGAQGIHADDVILCPPKMFFAYGLGNQVYFPIRSGATNIVNTGPITPDRIWQLWLEHQPTIVMSVPTLFAGMLQVAEKSLGQARVREACRRLRFSVSGGEILPPALLERWQAFTGTDILDGVGSTEMTHMFTLNRPGQPVPGSCGKIVDGFTAEVLDEEGRPVPVGEIGNLHVYGPTAARAYWNKPEKTAAVMGRGGVMTGDKVRCDEDGNFYLVGRSDDMLRVGAIWVSPAEVENALASHPAVLECAVVGRPDEQEMIKPKAYVVLRNGLPPEPAAVEAELKAHVRERLAHIKCPRWITFVEDLPKTSTGKIQRYRLRAAD
ncbi:MAG TPA: benzoate-CoA ligase family protein [Alphaproteobacteria bacterium]